MKKCLVCAATTVMAVAGVTGPAYAAPQTLTLNSSFGVSGGGNTLVGTVPASAPNTFAAGSVPVVQFQSGSCANQSKPVAPIVAGPGGTLTAGAVTVRPNDVTRISGTKVAFKVPSRSYPELDSNGSPSTVNTDGLALVSGQTSAKWSVCLYDTDTPGGSLLASTTYNLVQKPTITGVTPAASPAGGGTTVTVTGSGFQSATVGGPPITASIGGSPLTNIKVAANGSSFTATTGPRAAGSNLFLTVNAAGGTVVSSDPDNDPTTYESPVLFEYSNGITVTPSLTPGGSTVTLDIVGAGFSSLTFDANGGPTSANAHVFLVRGAYVAAGNRGVAECTGVVVIADTELICTLDLSGGSLNPVTSAAAPSVAVPDGAYTVTVVKNGSTSVGSDAEPSIVSSGSTFTVGPY
ncbi:IPT/TIG domain-containing protein [Actinoplanes sp. G11-F43]|uniref:IPT/TIG domain-containing protein n=1 Tax=Actinoplanes sp. G11-F43 TaxID=3424130 RepID=UPI003D3505BC